MRGEAKVRRDFEEDVLEPFQLNIVHQISRALQFFSFIQRSTRPISTIYLSGGDGIVERPVFDVVQQELGLTTSVLPIPVSGMELASSVAVSGAQSRNAAKSDGCDGPGIERI